MKFSIFTLGCKVNQYEAQALEKELIARGHTPGSFDEPCDAYIINTCTVTAVSDKKSRQMIRRARKEAPGAVVAVCGCYAQTSPDDIRALGVDVIAGTDDRLCFLDLIEAKLAEKSAGLSGITAETGLDDALRRRDFELLPAGGLQSRTRAMLKVEDGCRNFCAYCIIPYARGAVRSLPMDEAVRQAERLAAEGYREIVLTGIEISSYGADLGSDLTGLCSALCSAVPDCRIRLGSLEPRTVTEEFCRALSIYPNLCPHFHLSLQSGCDETLSRMRRKYDAARYFESVRLLREFFPGCGITTDLIVGFPGETDEEFSKTLDFIRRCAFSGMHIFPYSRRKGTPAATFPAQVEKSVKERRAAQAAAVAAEMKAAFLSAQVGKTLEVLFEQRENGLWAGHAPNYAQVLADSPEELHGRVLPARILSVQDGYLLASV